MSTPYSISARSHIHPKSVKEEMHWKVMHLLHKQPDITQRELALALGVSLGAVNYCLKALIARGWVKMKNFANSKNKFGYMYVLTPSGIHEKSAIAQRFLVQKIQEYELLQAEIDFLKNELEPLATQKI